MASSVSLRLKPRRQISIQNPSFLHFFSSSSDPTSTPLDSSSPQSPSQSSSSSFSSYFSDVKASLKKNSPPPPPPRRQFSPLSESPNSTPPPPNQPSKVASLEEIRKNLAEFRRRTSPPSSQSPSSPSISFGEIYKRNVLPTGQEFKSDSTAAKTGKLSFDAIRESLKQLRGSAATNKAVPDRPSLSKLKDSLKLRSTESGSVVIGGAEKLPESVFSKGTKEKKEAEMAAMRTEFVKTYSYGELGEKLRKLRPERKMEDNWFSLEELNERLMKLREIEEKETEANIGGVFFKDIRESLVKLSISEGEKQKKQSSKSFSFKA